MKTSELTGADLDWAVAKCEGVDIDKWGTAWVKDPKQPHFNEEFRPSTDWAQGGPIIERESITTCWEGTTWVATLFNKNCGETWYGHHYGPTPLIAAMRCYVASKLGDEVEIPEELTQ